MELTNCSADAAVIALHDANNDLDRAISALLDGEPEVFMLLRISFTSCLIGICFTGQLGSFG